MNFLTNTAQQELQAQLNLLASILLGDLAKFLRPRLIVRNTDTASTDGRLWVTLPIEFLGKKLEDQTDVFTGLLGHEVGHWLQPLNQIEDVEKETGLNHDIVNIILDIHDEALIVSIFPLLRIPLRAVRTLVSLKHMREYMDAYRTAPDFLGAVSAALLYGRYCVNQQASFSRPDDVLRQSNRKAVPDSTRMSTLVTVTETVVDLRSCELPQFFEELARLYPELCTRSSPSVLQDPMGGAAAAASGGDGKNAVLDQLQGQGLNLKPESDLREQVWEEKLHGSIPTGADVQALARQLKARWSVPRSAMAIAAPGRLNRQAAIRDEPLPFTMPLKIKGREMPLAKVFLLLDWSGSMKGAPWQSALKAAQAITLAMQTSGGDVRVGIFSGHLFHAPSFSPDALFAASLGTKVCMSEANGPDTSFRWLPRIWQQFPGHRILLLTDGVGYIPETILPSQRARTAAILLRQSVSAEDQVNIENTIRAFASQFVHVDELSQLASAWATLIPRRSIA